MSAVIFTSAFAHSQRPVKHTGIVRDPIQESLLQLKPKSPKDKSLVTKKVTNKTDKVEVSDSKGKSKGRVLRRRRRWRRRRHHRRNRRRQRHQQRQQQRHGQHGQQVVLIPDRHVPVDSLVSFSQGNMTGRIDGIEQDLPQRARVNLFRVNCRLFNNCTHIRRPHSFEPEIIIPENTRGFFPNKGNVVDSTWPNATLDELTLRSAVHDPTDELINHLTQFGKDRRVTLWVQWLFRQDRLPVDNNIMDLVDKNYFIGLHHNVGNRRIRDIAAIRQMNYEQYFRHKQVTTARAMHTQRLVANYGSEKARQRLMWGLRQLRQVVYESIVQMESVIYFEQGSLVKRIREAWRRSNEAQSRQLNETMRSFEGRPYTPVGPDRRDIFTD